MKAFSYKKGILAVFALGLLAGGSYLVFCGKSQKVLSVKDWSIPSPCRDLSAQDLKKKKGVETRIQKLESLMKDPIDWIFKDIHGGAVDLYCFRGKILLINFWASWCPPCIEELPSLSHLAEQNKDQIAVLAISTESLETVQSFLKKSFSDLSPHLKVARVSKEEKLRLFPEDKLPATYIFDREGRLKLKETGARDWADPSLVQNLLDLI